MVVAILIVAVLILVGAFTWMRPSLHDQRLAKLRTNALVNGFRVTSLKVQDSTEHGRVNHLRQIVTVYQIALVLDEVGAETFTVQRTSGESGAYLPDGWSWEARHGLTDQQYQSLNAFLTSLPDFISVVSLQVDSVGLSWDESNEDITFTGIKNYLTSCASIFQRQVL